MKKQNEEKEFNPMYVYYDNKKDELVIVVFDSVGGCKHFQYGEGVVAVERIGVNDRGIGLVHLGYFN